MPEKRSSNQSGSFQPSSDIEILIPDTNPRLTRGLWQLVMLPKRGASARCPPHKGGAPGDKRNLSEAEKTSQTSGIETAGTNLILIQTWWQQNILLPRGIKLINRPCYQLALDHFHYFGTDEDQCREWISQRVQSEKDTVFLRGRLDFNKNMAQQYAEIAARRLCEEEFAMLAITRLFTTPGFLPTKGNGQAWKARRTIQLYTQPDAKCGSLWAPPPLLNREEYIDNNFRLRPDCAYWLSVPSFVEIVRMATFTVVGSDVTTPYLTIEFKKSERSIKQATNQAIAASSLALYNRFRLKESRLSATKKPWNRKHFDQIRHYMMAFDGPQAIIWVVKLKSSAASDETCSEVAWNGCEAVRLLQCHCQHAMGVGDLVDYINAIHRWGLMHASYCTQDVKAILSAKGEEMAKLASNLVISDDLIEDDENVEAVGVTSVDSSDWCPRTS